MNDDWKNSLWTRPAARRFLAACAMGMLIGLAAANPASARSAYRLVRTFGQKQFDRPSGLALDQATGRIYVTDDARSVVHMFDRGGRYRGSFGGLGSEPGKFLGPLFVVTDDNGDIYVTDTGSHETPPGSGRYLSDSARVERFDRDGRFRNELRLPDNDAVHSAAANGPGGSLVLAKPGPSGERLVKYTPTLLRPQEAGVVFQSDGLTYLAADRRGYWVGAMWDRDHQRLEGPPKSGENLEQDLVRFDVRGKVREHVSPHIVGRIAGIASDPSSGRLYVAEAVRETYELGPNPAVYGANRIQVYDRRLNRIAEFPVHRPSAIALDANGDLYVATDKGVQVFARR